MATVRGILGMALVASIGVMGWWCFVWPGIAGGKADGPVMRTGAIATLLAFLTSLGGLLAIRAIRLRPFQRDLRRPF